MITGNDVVEYARTWLGVKWQHQGRGGGNPPVIDCAGLLIMIAQHYSLPYEDLQGYGRDPRIEFVRQIEKFTYAGDRHNPQHGSIGIFRDKIMPCHTGIITNAGTRKTVIHAECSPRRSCHEEPFEHSTPSLKDHLVAVRLFKDVSYGE